MAIVRTGTVDCNLMGGGKWVTGNFMRAASAGEGLMMASIIVLASLGCNTILTNGDVSLKNQKETPNSDKYTCVLVIQRLLIWGCAAGSLQHTSSHVEL